MTAALPKHVRHIAGILSVLLTTCVVRAQGTVNVNNRGLPSPQLVYFDSRLRGTAFPNGPVVGAHYVAQIAYGPSLISLGDPMPFRPATTTSPGTWNPGPAGIRTLEGFTEGQIVTMVVRVWDSSRFATWAEAQAVLAGGLGSADIQGGQSTMFNYTVGAAANPASLTMVNFRSFELTALVPEPSVVVLGALGCLGLIWCFRRR